MHRRDVVQGLGRSTCGAMLPVRNCRRGCDCRATFGNSLPGWQGAGSSVYVKSRGRRRQVESTAASLAAGEACG
eukprot:scaffold957_cov402-Prasinococcus_capsulatus_cf.AAC.16